RPGSAATSSRRSRRQRRLLVARRTVGGVVRRGRCRAGAGGDWIAPDAALLQRPNVQRRLRRCPGGRTNTTNPSPSSAPRGRHVPNSRGFVPPALPWPPARDHCLCSPVRTHSSAGAPVRRFPFATALGLVAAVAGMVAAAPLAAPLAAQQTSILPALNLADLD